MVEDGKAKTRKSKRLKAGAVTVAPRRSQRTLKDMFGVTSKPKEEGDNGQARESAIELSDSDQGAKTLPTTPVDIEDTERASEASSLASLNEETNALALKLAPPVTKPYSIFERPKAVPVLGNIDQISESGYHDAISVSDDELNIQDISTGQRLTVPSLSISSPTDVIQIPDSPSEGKTREEPIIVESPKLELGVLEKPDALPNKPVWSIFAPKRRTERQSSPKVALRVAAPLPEKDTQHIRGPQTLLTSTTSCVGFRDKGKRSARESSELPGSLPAVNSSLDAQQSCSTPLVASEADFHSYIDTIPRPDQHAPSISRLLRHVNDDQPDVGTSLAAEKQLWTDKWHPRRAEEVIGNERHAAYLRDWLVALRLQSEPVQGPSSSQGSTSSKGKKRKLARRKKPDIVRHVKKQRRSALQSEMEDFFAPENMSDSDDDLAMSASSDFDDITFCQQMQARLGESLMEVPSHASPSATTTDDELPPSIAQPTRFGRQIKNTILLTGPSGSGKTAAVYACAEELGWEVFEVYPGIGERNGAALQKLIGDVGKNHIVKSNPPSPRGANAKLAFFNKPNPPTRRSRALRQILDSSDVESIADEEVIEIVDDMDPPLPPEPLPAESSQASVRQSLILIEEVDILYKADTNFWPALINIIKDCRRPVVLTCNDVALVPCHDLPLQTTLAFEACPSTLATSYLQALCLAEGQKFTRDSLNQAYDNYDYLFGSHDLRRSINQLQFTPANCIHSTTSHLACQSLSTTAEAEEASLPVSMASSPLTSLDSSPASQPVPLPVPDCPPETTFLRTLERARDNESFIDAFLDRESTSALPDLSRADLSSARDDELGHAILYSERDLDHIPVSSFYHQDQSMLADTLERSHDILYQTGAADDLHMDVGVITRLEQERLRYVDGAGQVLQGIGPFAVSAIDASLYLDYAPWIRYIIAVEDNMAKATMTSQPRSQSQGRTTRNSQRTEMNRWLALREEDRRLLVSTSLRWDEGPLQG